MGTLSLEKIDHLLWLGRYVERSYTTLRFITVTYDKAIDSTDGNWKGQLEELGFASESENVLEFFRDCLFNEGNLCSLAHSMGAAYDNAVMLRDVLGPEGYIVTPGVRPAGAALGDQSRVATPAQAFANGASHIVIGRPITQAADPAAAFDAIVAELD